ncbi:MAG: translation initiation factor eIF-1A [Thermoproteota archaeon]
MGKRKVYTEEEISKSLVTPGEGQFFGKVDGLYGFGWLSVVCTDGKRRKCRVRGKLRRKIWVKQGDIVLVEPWKFDDGRGEILFRYTGGQVDYLVSKNLLPSSMAEGAS